MRRRSWGTWAQGARIGDVCEAEDHQTEDDGYEPEGIDLDSDETNTHGELDGNTHWVYEHEGLIQDSGWRAWASSTRIWTQTQQEHEWGIWAWRTQLWGWGMGPCLVTNITYVPIPCTHVLILHTSQLQSLPLLAPHTCAPYCPTSFFWGTTPAPTPTPTPPLTFNSAMCNCPAPLFHPTCVAHLLMAHQVRCWGVIPLPRVSISTSAELEDAAVVSSKDAGGHAGECYGRFRVPRSIRPTPPPIYHLISLYIGPYNTPHPNIPNSTNPLGPSSGYAHAYWEDTQAQNSYRPLRG
jgi:hypothetical protein